MFRLISDCTSFKSYTFKRCHDSVVVSEWVVWVAGGGEGSQMVNKKLIWTSNSNRWSSWYSGFHLYANQKGDQSIILIWIKTPVASILSLKPSIGLLIPVRAPLTPVHWVESGRGGSPIIALNRRPEQTEIKEWDESPPSRFLRKIKRVEKRRNLPKFHQRFFRQFQTMNYLSTVHPSLPLSAPQIKWRRDVCGEVRGPVFNFSVVFFFSLPTVHGHARPDRNYMQSVFAYRLNYLQCIDVQLGRLFGLWIIDIPQHFLEQSIYTENMSCF